MSVQLQERVKTLEARVAALEAKLAEAITIGLDYGNTPAVTVAYVEPTQVASASKRGLCPKCGVKPNYYMHTKWCKGQQ